MNSSICSEPALARRQPPIDVDADALADHLFTTFEGGFILCRALENPSAMHDQLRIFRQLVEALLAIGRLERQPRRHRARRPKLDA